MQVYDFFQSFTYVSRGFLLKLIIVSKYSCRRPVAFKFDTCNNDALRSVSCWTRADRKRKRCFPRRSKHVFFLVGPLKLIIGFLFFYVANDVNFATRFVPDFRKSEEVLALGGEVVVRRHRDGLENQSAVFISISLASKRDIEDVVFTCLISTDTLIKVAFGGVEHVSQQPPRQPEQTGTSSALALPGIVLFSHMKKSLYFNWDNPELAPCGLINCGNICLANVILQCLLWTRPLVAYLLERGHMSECRILRDDWCFFCKFETYVERTSQSRFPFSPVNNVYIFFLRTPR
ncbi:unnamed protein product [Brassica oleracea]